MTRRWRNQVLKWGNPMWTGYRKGSRTEALPSLQSLKPLLGKIHLMPSARPGSLSACSDGSHSGLETSLRKLLAFFSYAVGCAQQSSALIWSKGDVCPLTPPCLSLRLLQESNANTILGSDREEQLQALLCWHPCFQYPGEVTFGMYSSYSKDSVTI